MGIGYLIQGGNALTPFIVEARKKGVELERYEDIPSKDATLQETVVIDPAFPRVSGYYSNMKKWLRSNTDTQFLILANSSREEDDFKEHLGQLDNVEYLTIRRDGPRRLLDLLS